MDYSVHPSTNVQEAVVTWTPPALFDPREPQNVFNAPRTAVRHAANLGLSPM